MPQAHPLVVVHPTDLLPESDVAFTHAVALAAHAGGELIALHANPKGDARAPKPERLLQQWGVKEHLRYRFVVHSCCDDPVDTALDALRTTPADLLVVGTHQRHGLERVLKDSFSESLAIETSIPTLFVPIGEPGMVDARSGAITIRRVLIPVGGGLDLSRAVEHAARLAEVSGDPNVEFYVLHIGRDPFPHVDIPQSEPGWQVHEVSRDGDLHTEIVNACRELSIDLVVMATQGHSSVLDFFRGSNTERVIRSVALPVLSVPVMV